MAELINPGNRDPAAGEVEEAEAEGGTFRLLVERSPVAMGIVDREGRIEYANPALAQRYGEALAGARTVAEFVELGALDVADAQRGLDYWREAILGWKPGDPEPEPYEGRIRSGEDVKHVLYRFTMIGSRVVVVVEDVTGFRRAEELEASNRRLRISEAKYRRLHQSITDACATIDLEGRITDFNPAFGEMLGYSAAELRQLTYREVTPERWHALEQDILREQILVHGHSEVYEKEYRRKDGTIVPVELRCFLVRDDNGEPVQSWAIIRDITERKCMEERLRQSNASLEERVAERTAELDESVKRYQTLFDAQADMVIVTDAGNRILEANQAACEQLGYSREELFRLRHTDFGTPLPETEREEVRRELLAGRAVSVLSRYTRKDGTSFPAEVKVVASEFDGAPVVFCAVRDVTERELAQQDLRESEQRFRQLAEAAFEGILITENGRILDSNARLADMLGSTVRDLIGQSALEVVAPGFRRIEAAQIESGSEAPYKIELLRVDGRVFPAAMQARMRDWQDRPVRVTAVRDLTESKRLEDELAAHRAELARAHKLAMLSEVSAGVLHQIGQPLSIIVNNVAAARDMVSACETPTCGSLPILRDADAELRRLRKKIDHLRILAHPEQQNREPVTIEALVREALADVEAVVSRHGIRIEEEIEPGLPKVLADAVQLGQVLVNVLRNAVEAVANCSVERRTISLAVRSVEADAVEVVVRDAGSGIQPEALPSIFEPFFTTKPEGTGIGLALSRTILKAHGGVIEGRNNRDGHGATFRLVLPTGKEGS